MSKVSIVGAGFVGSTIAHWAMVAGGCQVVLVDIVEGLAKGKILDLVQAGPIAGHSVDAIGSSDYADTANSDLVIITAGIPRKPGMTREDLVQINANIVTSVINEVVPRSPNAIVIMMTNPLDTMTYLAYKVSGLPRERIMGQAGVLDSGRMRTFIAMETGIDPENIHTTVLGGHGDEMVPLVRYSNIAGMPLSYFLSLRRSTRSSPGRHDGGAGSCAISRPAAPTTRPAPRRARWRRRSSRINTTSTPPRSFSRANMAWTTSALACLCCWGAKASSASWSLS